MNIKTLIVTLITLLMLNQCENKKPSKDQKSKSEKKDVVLKTYKIISDYRVRDSLKLADARYIYDYQVSSPKELTIDEEILKQFKTLIEDKSNFYDDDVVNQCNPKIDFFMGWDNTAIYGLHLTSECPLLYKITYNEADTNVEKIYILEEKKSKFTSLINQIQEI